MNREQAIANIGKTRGVMGLLDITSSGMFAQSEKLKALSETIANFDAIKGSNNDYYTRKRISFKENLNSSQKKFDNQGGVEAVATEEKLPLERIYDPGNPKADQEGFVYKPKMNFIKTVAAMSLGNKYFEANLNFYKAQQQMAQQVIDLGR